MGNYTTWMSTDTIQNLTLGNLKLPGTHDSATFSLTDTMSQVSYDDISFLFALNPGSAPAPISLPQFSQAYPSLVVFNNLLYMAFLANNSNEILICSSPDGMTWTGNTTIPGQLSKFAPSLAVLGDTLYVAFVSNNNDNQILIWSATSSTSAPDVLIWAAFHSVGQSTNAAPSLAAFGNTLYVAFRSNSSKNELLVCSYAGTAWSNNADIHQSSSTAPSLVACNNTLYLAFVSNNDDDEILCGSLSNLSNGITWTSCPSVNQTTNAAPSLAAFGNTLFVGFTTSSSKSEILVCSFDGTAWSYSNDALQQGQFGLSLAAFNNQLLIAFVANNDNNELLTCSSSDGTVWTTPFPWSTSTYYVGPQMYQFVMNVVLPCSISQDQTILDQLNGGIRYFDLRIYFDSRANDFYIQHALRGCTLTSILQQVAQFIANNPGNQELILLQLSHTNFTDVPQDSDYTAAQLAGMVAALIAQYLPNNVYMPTGAAGAPSYDFNQLASLTLADVTQNQTAVLFLNGDSAKYTYPTQVVNTTGFSYSNRSAGGTDTVADLSILEQGPLQSNPAGTLYQISWTLTPQASDIFTQAQNNMLGISALPILQQLGLTANANLQAFLALNQTANFNLVTVDWYEQGAALTVVDMLVGLNNGLPIPTTT